MSVKTYWLERIPKLQRSLRRFTYGTNCGSRAGKACPAAGEWGHNASVKLDVIILPGLLDIMPVAREVAPLPDPVPYPLACTKCGYVFTPEDEFQVNGDWFYRRGDTGEEMILDDAPPGATWDAHWMHDCPDWCGPDGLCIFCRCPDGHDWMIDSRASNCTLPQDKVHRCWIRHGDPRKAELTVDKNGVTCAAGAGSILTPHWHGFLRGGLLVE